jgi:hypothetical protein
MNWAAGVLLEEGFPAKKASRRNIGCIIPQPSDGSRRSRWRGNDGRLGPGGGDAEGLNKFLEWNREQRKVGRKKIED